MKKSDKLKGIINLGENIVHEDYLKLASQTTEIAKNLSLNNNYPVPTSYQSCINGVCCTTNCGPDNNNPGVTTCVTYCVTNGKLVGQYVSFFH